VSNLFSHLTRDAQQVITQANRIAKQHRQPVVDSDVLLLGLLRLSSSQTETVLRELRINSENLITRLSASIKLQAQEEQKQIEAGLTHKRITFSADVATILTQRGSN